LRRGYQGIDKVHKAPEFPYKSSKNKPLEAEEKAYSTWFSRFRIVVEHIFGDIKTLKMMSDGYRNKIKRYGLKFNMIAAIVNLKNSFA
jgi:hypothetical protein